MMAFYAWRKRNVFREMYEALLDNPDAARLTAWLRSITD
jgi:hypothetical protein